MTNVDVRRFSITALEKSKDFNWVNDYNNSHGPNTAQPNHPAPHFSTQKVAEILQKVDDTGILADVNYDEEQIKLISKSLLAGMMQRSMG